MRALVCLALVSICVAFGQSISTKRAYLPSALAAQVKADTEVDADCPPLAESVATTWLRLSRLDPLSVRVDGRGPCLEGANNRTILLYARSGDAWRKVLETVGNGLRRLPDEHHGWRDIEVLGHSDAFMTVHYIFRFEGREYKPAECAEIDNTVGGPPRPKRQPCSFDWKASHDQPTTSRVETEPRQ